MSLTQALSTFLRVLVARWMPAQQTKSNRKQRLAHGPNELFFSQRSFNKNEAGNAGRGISFEKKDPHK
jgi:hypothetical protein